MYNVTLAYLALVQRYEENEVLSVNNTAPCGSAMKLFLNTGSGTN
jgi:hypothetical protein